jgi:outer membrane receptor protein involved in Fe transport
MPQNIGQTLSRGIALSVYYENYFNEFYIRADLSYSINYTINNDPASVYFGKRIIYSPLYKTAFGVEASYMKIWGIQTAFHHASERFTTEINNAWLPPYYVADVRVFWEFLYFSVENIFDYQYQEIAGYPQMGRSFTAGIDYKF